MSLWNRHSDLIYRVNPTLRGSLGCKRTCAVCNCNDTNFAYGKFLLKYDFSLACDAQSKNRSWLRGFVKFFFLAL